MAIDGNAGHLYSLSTYGATLFFFYFFFFQLEGQETKRKATEAEGKENESKLAYTRL